MNKTIKAAYLNAPESISIASATIPEPGADEVIVSPILTAICGSDISFYYGHRPPPYFPFILGHEVVGKVTGVGSAVTEFSIGQRVIVEPNFSCGVCAFCRTGRGNICADRPSLGVTIPGCFSELFAAPSEYCWPIPDSISDEDAVVIEPLTVSLHALLQSGAQLGDTIAVIGCGSTGLLLIQAAVAQGVYVLAHDLIECKLKIAQSFGAEVVRKKDVADLWEDAHVTTIFECAGVASTVDMAINAAPRGSQIILVGLSSSNATFQPLRPVREGLRISGSFIYNHPTDFTRSISLVENKVLEPKLIVSQILPLDRIEDAMKLAQKGETSKIVLAVKSE